MKVNVRMRFDFGFKVIFQILMITLTLVLNFIETSKLIFKQLVSVSPTKPYFEVCFLVITNISSRQDPRKNPAFLERDSLFHSSISGGIYTSGTGTSRRRHQLDVIRRAEVLPSLRGMNQLGLIRAARVADGMRGADRGLVAGLVAGNVASRMDERDVNLR